MKESLRQTPRMLFEKSYKLESGEVSRFAAAIGCENKIFTDVETAKQVGYKELPAVATFPDFFNYNEEICKKLDIDEFRLTLCSHQIEWFKPLCAGDEIDIKVSLVESSERSGPNVKLICLTIETEAISKRGVSIFTGRRGFIYTVPSRS